jgi:hypothetical protein
MIFRRQDENVVFLGRDGPSRDVFGDDLAREWLWAGEFGH